MRTVAGLVVAAALIAGCGGGSESSDTPTTTDTPAAGPSGDLIAFNIYGDGDEEIFVMNADGSQVRPLTSNDDWDHNPAWSPDGTRIAFASDRAGERSVGDFDIFVMSDFGSQIRQLTDSDSGDHSWCVMCGNDAPAWSPDGKRIAFSGTGDGDSEIFVMNADGTEVRQLTDNDSGDGGPAWSPDGTRIAFNGTRDGDSEIFVMNADGTEVRQVTGHDSDDYSPAWSPDGKRIAFVSYRDGDSEIFVMNADGTDVYSTGRYGESPSWGG